MLFRDRPLVAVTLVLLAGILLGEAFSYFPLTITFLTLLLFFLEGFFYRSAKLPFSFFIVGVGAFLFIQLTSRPVASDDLRWLLDKGPIRIIAEVSEPPRISPKHISFRMKAIEILSNRETQPVKGVFQLNIWRKDVPYRYGDRLDIRIRLRRSRQFQNDGVFQYADYRERVGWSGVANLSNLSRVKKVGEGGNPILKQIFLWRDEIRGRILSSIKMPQAAMLMAFVIGESAYLTDEVRETFTGSGVAHLLAVSGAHLAFVSMFIFGFTRWAILRLPEAILLRVSVWKLPSQWAALVTACAALFYTGLAGAKIGTLRALTMILVYLVSIWIDRSKDTKISLSVAALLMILSQPRAVFELSFQLSFLAVLSIILFVEWWQETGPTEFIIEEKPSIQKQIARRVRPFFLSTIAATLGTVPITLYYFHQFSWSGLMANPILLPLAGWVMVPFGLFSALVSLFLEDGFAFAIWHEHLWLLFYKFISFFAAFPGSDLHFASPPLSLLFCYYAVFFYMITRKKSRQWFVVFVFSFFLFFLGWGGIRVAPAGLRVTFLDVAQGDATVVEFSNGETMLIDGGNKQAGKFGVAPFLWEQRIRKIDYLVATHPQFDHIGGLPYIIRRFDVGEVWTNGFEHDIPAYRSLLSAIQTKGLVHRIVSNKQAEMKMGNCKISFLHPEGSKLEKIDGGNNQSIVMRLSCPSAGNEKTSFLFTGDIEEEAESALIEKPDRLRSRILKVPHHGSRSSSSEDFISVVSPKIATISAGYRNRYRHPHPDVVSAYRAMGTAVYRTDEVGAITIEIRTEEGNVDGDRNKERLWSYRNRRIERIEWSGSLLAQEWHNIKRGLRIF